jgi:hypothetical protein
VVRRWPLERWKWAVGNRRIKNPASKALERSRLVGEASRSPLLAGHRGAR